MKKILILIGTLFLISCNKQENGINIENLNFTIQSRYGTHYITGYEIPFKATDSHGNDITSSVKFYINGTKIPGSTYLFDRVGYYMITAQWNLGGGTIKESQNRIEALVTNPRNETFVLLEDFTGTWCVNCPRVHYKIDQLLHQHDHVYAIAIHDRGHQTDPFHFEKVSELTQTYQISGYPTALINRKDVWNEENSSVEQYLQRTQALGLKIENTFNNNTLNISVKVRFDMDLKNEHYKLVVYALENNLHADQANSTDYYGGQDPIPGMEHNHVLRHAFTQVLGDEIPASQCHFDNEFTWHFSGDLPSNIADPAHVEIIAFVVEGNDRPRVINSKKTKINSSADY